MFKNVHILQFHTKFAKSAVMTQNILNRGGRKSYVHYLQWRGVFLDRGVILILCAGLCMYIRQDRCACGMIFIGMVGGSSPNVVL